MKSDCCQCFQNVSGPLKNAIVFLPIARSSAALNFYYSLEDVHMSSGNVYVSAIDFGKLKLLFIFSQTIEFFIYFYLLLKRKQTTFHLFCNTCYIICSLANYIFLEGLKISIYFDNSKNKA